MIPEREQKSGVCIHGALRRQCETCDLAERLDAAEAKCKALEKVAEAAREVMVEAENDRILGGGTALLHLDDAPAALNLATAISAAPPRDAEGWATFIETLHGYMEGTSTAEDVRQTALAVNATPTASQPSEREKALEKVATAANALYWALEGMALGIPNDTESQRVNLANALKALPSADGKD
jgi:hypothetical protein